MEKNVYEPLTVYKILCLKPHYTWLLFTRAPCKILPKDFWWQNCYRIIKSNLPLANTVVLGILSEGKIYRVISNGSWVC